MSEIELLREQVVQLLEENIKLKADLEALQRECEWTAAVRTPEGEAAYWRFRAWRHRILFAILFPIVLFLIGWLQERTGSHMPRIEVDIPDISGPP